ncbi:MAG: energy transducer TonB, partial [Arenimonas sp.]|nr:energy transducer TonB [Arenimonas sp.]
FLSAVQARDWHQVVDILERKSPRNFFLRALLIGLLLSVPWQCSRIIYNAYFAAKPEISTNTSAPLTRPNFDNGSVTNMPNPRAPRPVTQSITPPKSEPEVTAEPVETPIDASVLQADHDAKVIYQTTPKYPTNIFRKNTSGTVVLKVLIDSSGLPKDITIEKSSETKSLDRAARKAVSEWKFSPKISNGVAVPSELLIPIEFKSE